MRVTGAKGLIAFVLAIGVGLAVAARRVPRAAAQLVGPSESRAACCAGTERSALMARRALLRTTEAVRDPADGGGDTARP